MESMCSVAKKTSKKTNKQTSQQVVINHVPGEECRIAVLANGKLEEYYTERTSEDLHVGNIYLGVVRNIESSIQAAFIDFGIGRNGFLHISDLHPMYFPGTGTDGKEQVGRKTPHRERPPIQSCLKKGQKVVVQVIKEGIGSKGPTLTSYPSIPARFLVIMPFMEDHGVSRKLEDIEERREAKKVLTSLDLPKEFGFILRTSGLDRTKTELKRDAAFLVRLWKDIDRKRKKAKGPVELYAESGIILRTIRDMDLASVDRIWVDDPRALSRIDDYLRIVSPRKRSTDLMLHHRDTPIFHDFGVEPQIDAMHHRTVGLPGGGSIVIDSTEAMVAIDVNSGKTHKYRDAETMAYEVNSQAVDEIARQLRLRDLGGLIVLDLIDMRDSRHQRSVENRMRDNLKRDRARSETQRISRFGLLEMTRQRMRPAVRKSHFVECPTCTGVGHVRSTDALVADALRQMAFILQQAKVDKVEMVVNAAVAGLLLTRKRRELAAIEDRTGKTVEVRVSKTIAADRIDFYAYDSHNADLEMDLLKEQFRDPSKAEGDAMPDLSTADEADSETGSFAVSSHTGHGAATQMQGTSAQEIDGEDESSDEDAAPRKRKRRRRRRRGGSRPDDRNNEENEAEASSRDEQDVEQDESVQQSSEDSIASAWPLESAPSKNRRDKSESNGDDAPSSSKKRRRRRGRRGGRDTFGDANEVESNVATKSSSDDAPNEATSSAKDNAKTTEPSMSNEDEKDKPRRKTRRGGRRRGRRGSGESQSEGAVENTNGTLEATSTSSDSEPTSGSSSSDTMTETDDSSSPTTTKTSRKKKKSTRKTSTRRNEDANQDTPVAGSDDGGESEGSSAQKSKKTTKKKRQTRKKSTSKKSVASGEDDSLPIAAESGDKKKASTKKKTSRTRKKTKKTATKDQGDSQVEPKSSRRTKKSTGSTTAAKNAAAPPVEEKSKRRTLYGSRRRITREEATRSADQG